MENNMIELTTQQWEHSTNDKNTKQQQPLTIIKILIDYPWSQTQVFELQVTQYNTERMWIHRLNFLNLMKPIFHK